MKERNTHTFREKIKSVVNTGPFSLISIPWQQSRDSHSIPMSSRGDLQHNGSSGFSESSHADITLSERETWSIGQFSNFGIPETTLSWNQRTNWTLLIGNTTVQLGGSWTRPARASEAWAPNHHTALLPLAWMTAKPVKCFPECFPSGWHLLSTCVTVYRIQFKCSIV